tara:strand:+ start:95 stop:307 length:213 start_codon:yes stop_codon:yes gene_type:complete
MVRKVEFYNVNSSPNKVRFLFRLPIKGIVSSNLAMQMIKIHVYSLAIISHTEEIIFLYTHLEVEDILRKA